MRRVAFHDAALVQSLAHQIDLQLLQIAHAAVHEFRRTARRALGEILALEQNRFVTARRGIHGATQTRRSAAYHHYIPYLSRIVETR